MKYKAGDVVQVKSLAEIEAKGVHNFKFGFVEEMLDYCGNRFTIKDVLPDGKVIFENAPPEVQFWSWSESMLDLCASISEPAECEIMNLF